jgi:hypothetical protein
MHGGPPSLISKPIRGVPLTTSLLSIKLVELFISNEIVVIGQSDAAGIQKTCSNRF